MITVLARSHNARMLVEREGDLGLLSQQHLFLIIRLRNILRKNYLASQLFCNLDDFISAWMLAKINTTEKQRTVTKLSLFW